MKTSLTFNVFALLFCTAFLCQAQQAVKFPPPTSYSIVQRDANSRVWQQTTYETSSSGQQIPHLHQYTEMASGLCYQKDGQWMDSTEQIQILPDGSAAATNGAHQAYFPADIYNGVIRLVTPDGLKLQSRPLGLSYDDGTNSVLIAELTNSVGQLISSNQVIYTNAFIGIDADLLYTYRKSGFEQDVIFRAQPLAPEQFGLDSTNTRLQLLTEFFNPPPPVQSVRRISPLDELPDTALAFGTTKMIPGKAFLTSAINSQGKPNQIRVYKSWVVFQGRPILVEQVPYPKISPQLATLRASGPGMAMSADSILRKVSSSRLLPPTRLAQAVTNVVKFAKVNVNQNRGVVLDYVTLDSYYDNYTFQSGTTYLVQGTTAFEDTTTIKGGAVIKMDSGTWGSITIEGILVCQSTEYHPAIFTSGNDNSVGEDIGDSTGSPDMRDSEAPFLLIDSTNAIVLHDLRFCYNSQAVYVDTSPSSVDAWDCQCFQVDNIIDGWNVGLHNVLIARNDESDAAAVNLEGNSLIAENVTADGGGGFVSIINGGSVALTNCVVTSQGLTDGYSVAFSTNAVIWQSTPSVPIYQIADGGNYYLTNNSPARGTGATNIDTVLLADLAQKTTYGPTILTNAFTTNTTLAPCVALDNGSTLDIGYHYTPLDYILAISGANAIRTNVTLTLTNGVAVRIANSLEVTATNVSLVSIGTATAPNLFVDGQTVQEQSGIGDYSRPMIWFAGTNEQASFEFSKFINVNYTTYLESLHVGFTVRNCEFYFGGEALNPSYIFNNLFVNNSISVNSGPGVGAISNNLFYASTISLSSSNVVFNNDFDSSELFFNTNVIADGYNAYLNCNTRLYPTNLYDIVTSTGLAYESSSLGDFYQPSDSPLKRAGSTTADQIGLYHFTTQTNQIPDGTNLVDIGYHYVATDTNGNPVSTPGDGIPDYLADANGNGIDDINEVPWDFGFLLEPQSTNIVQGQNVTFSTTIVGAGPFTYQWQSNDISIAGANASSYTVLVVPPAYDGYAYSVIVSNANGHVTSTNAILSVSTPVSWVSGPLDQTVVQGTNVSFSATFNGDHLTYQWYTNSTGLHNNPKISGATSSALTISNVTLSDMGNYSVIASNIFNGAASGSAKLTVVTNPVISFITPKTNVIQSEDVTFSVLPAYAQYFYQWWSSNSIAGSNNIANANQPSYTLLVAQTTNDGFFGVVVTNIAGSTNDSSPLNVLVPPWITQPPTNLTVIQGNNATFSISAFGTTNLYYQWFENGTNLITWATTNSLTITNVQGINAGGYSCVVSNVAGTNMSAWAWLSVNLTGGGTTNGWGGTGGGTPPDPVPTIFMISPTNASPTNSAIFSYNNPISIRAHAFSQFSSITNVAFYFTGTNADAGTNFMLAGTAVPGPNGDFALAWNNMIPGTNIIKARAWDYNGNSNDSSLVYVIMTQPPHFLRAPDTNLIWEEGIGSTNISLSAVFQDDGQPFSFITNVNWTAPSGVILSNPHSFTTGATFSTNGAFPLQLEVDNGYATNYQTTTVTIRRRPQVSINFPTNNAGFPLGFPLVLKATATSIDSTIDTVTFYTNSAPFGASAIKSLTNSFTYLWIGTTNDTYSLTAVATDGYGIQNTSTPSETVTIYNPNPYVQINYPVNQTFTAWSNIVITALATNSSFAAPVAWVKFFDGTNFLGMARSSNSIYQAYWMPFDAGVHVLMAEAIASNAIATNGLTAWSVPVTNTIYGTPDVAISTPPNYANLGSMLVNTQITAAVTSAGAAIINVSFYTNNFLLGTNLNGSYQINWLNVASGQYTLTATATDTNGATGISPNIFITVEPSNQPPSVYAGPDQVTNLPSTVLSGIVSDDGLPANFLSVEWSLVSSPPGGTVMFANSNLVTTPVTFNTNGFYEFKLLATDGKLTNSAVMTVLVTNSAPIVNAGPDQTVLLPGLSFTNPVQFQEINPAVITNSWYQYYEVSGYGDHYGLGAGMDYFASSNCLIFGAISVDADLIGDDFGLYLLDTNFVLDPFSIPDEDPFINIDYWPSIPIVTARDSLGGFAVGETFCRGPGPGQVMRIEPNGTSYGGTGGSWVVLTNAVTDERNATGDDGYAGYIAAICLDQTGVWGRDVIVETIGGDIWRINSAGQATEVYNSSSPSFPTCLSATSTDNHAHAGITVIPDDAQKYGPWAGRLLLDTILSPAAGYSYAGIWNSHSYTMLTIDTNGFLVYYDPFSREQHFSMGSVTTIPKNENLFIISPELDNMLWGVPASQFNGMEGDILMQAGIVNEESGGVLYKFHWDGNAFHLTVNPKTDDGQNSYDQLTFCPAGERGIPPINSHLQLQGAVNAAGLTSNLWHEISAPPGGTVTFDDPTATNTFAEFSTPGIYTLRLTANDGQFTTYDDVQINVLNSQLAVDAGTNQIIPTTNAILPVVVTDTLGASNQISLSWVQVGGPPGGVANLGWVNKVTNMANTFIVSVTNTASFTAPGQYVLQLTANDGLNTSSTDITIAVESPSIALTPHYGWPSLTNTPFTVTANLVDSNNIPIAGSNVEFSVEGASGMYGDGYGPTYTNVTDINGNTSFTYSGTNQGRDMIIAMATVNGQSVSNTIFKDWAMILNCDSVITNGYQSDAFGPEYDGYYTIFDAFAWWPESVSSDVPANTNEVAYADNYIFYGTSNTTITLSLLESSGFQNLGLILKDPSNNIVAVAGETADNLSDAPGSRYYANCSLTNRLVSSGEYLIEVVNLGSLRSDGSQPEANELLYDYALGVSCNGDTNSILASSPQLEVMFNGTNIASGGTITFPTTTFDNSTNVTLLISNVGSADLQFGGSQLNGDFSVTNDLSGVTIPPGGSTNLVVAFGASADGPAIGQLVLYGNIPVSGCYQAYLSASAFDPGAPPSIIITAPRNLATYYAPAFIPITATVSPGVTNIVSVGFEETTSTGTTAIGNASYITNNIWGGIWNDVPNGNYKVAAVATDASGRTTTSPAISITVYPIVLTNHPPVATNLQFRIQENSVNNVLNPLAYDHDPDGDPLKIIGIIQPLLGTESVADIYGNGLANLSAISDSSGILNLGSSPGITPSSSGTATVINNGANITYTPKSGYASESIGGALQPFDEFSYQVSDGKGGVSSAEITIYVYPQVPPIVNITNPPTGYSVDAGSSTLIMASITNIPPANIAKVDFYLDNNFIGEVTNGSGGSYTLNWTNVFIGGGLETVTAIATDILGEQQLSPPVQIHVSSPPGALTGSIDYIVGSSGQTTLNPSSLVTIRDGIFQLYGKATNTTANVTWSLGVYSSDGTTLLRNLTPSLTGNIGTVSGAGLILSNCDLTTLINGVYDLRFTVIGGGQEASVDQQFILESNLKIGQFSFSQQDLVIPVNGIPLTVTRSYNSQDPHEGDFGYGWTYSLSDMDVQLDETREQKTDKRGNTYSIRTGGGRDVTLTLPNGQRTTFYYNPTYIPDKIEYQPHWQAGPGAPPNTKLEPGPNSAQVEDFLFTIDEGQPYWEDYADHSDVPEDAYDFPSFILTTSDGTRYLLERQNLGAHTMSVEGSSTGEGYIDQAWGTPYLAQIIERNTNTITFFTNAITFSSPFGATNHILIQHNNQGLISSISDPNSIASGGPPAVKYEYDNNQNLMYVERLINSSTSSYATNYFFYTNPNFPHYITSMHNGDGTQVAENFYDDSGKLTETVDASGNATYFNNNLTNNSEAVVDRLGNTNLFVYDSRGNVLTETDPLGYTTTKTYDDNNNVIQSVDPLSHTNTFAYDANNNLTMAIDSMNHTNLYKYDSVGDLTNAINAIGDVKADIYDQSGNLLQSVVQDTNGNVIAQAFSTYNNGLLTSLQNGSGQTFASFSYDLSSGFMTSAKNANGVTRNFAYDANGNQTNFSYVWTAPDGSQMTLTNLAIHDAQNRVTMSIDAYGDTNQNFYDLNSHVSYTIDKYGNTNSFLYDARGDLIVTSNAIGTVIYTVYDLAARPILTTDANGITGTRMEYDADGRVTNVIRLENVKVNLIPDANVPGLLTTVVVCWGTGLSTNSTTYYANGLTQSLTTPDGTTVYTYWPNGQTETVADPLGHTNTLAYTASGLQSVVWDANNHTTRFVYDAVGRMVSTIYDNNTSVSNVFNATGQHVGTIDQNGLLTQYAYNFAGNLTNVIKPSVAAGIPSWFYQYDTNGQLAVVTDPSGHSTTNLYDHFGHQVTQALPMGQTTMPAVYTNGLLWKQFDFMGQMIEHHYDNFGRETNKAYFATNATTASYAVSYAYNNLNQLTNVTQFYGSAASQFYTALDLKGTGMPMPARIIASLNRYPNVFCGTTAIFTFIMAMAIIPREKRRRLIIALKNDVKAIAIFKSFGCVVSERRRTRMPSLFWRIVAVFTMFIVLASQPGYYELCTARADCIYPGNLSSPPTIYVTTFTYDVEGNLTQVNSPEGVINYNYDLATGRLIHVCTINSEIEYGYDADGRLQTVHVIKRNGTSVNETTTYTYDAVGNRSEVDLPNGVITTYKYDDLNRLTNLTHTAQGGAVLANYVYQLDLTGRRTNAVEVLQQNGGTYHTNTLNWQFDAMYRLTNESCICSVSSASYTNSYAYDLVGNRIHKTYIGQSPDNIAYTYDNNDELASENSTLNGMTSYLYDGNGSLTNKTSPAETLNYAYNVANQLGSVTSGWNTTAYRYNQNGIRVESVTSGVATAYLVDVNNHTGFDQALEELPSFGSAPSRSYVMGDDVLVQADSSGNVSYLLQDGHGNTRQLVGASGVSSVYNFDAYGQSLGANFTPLNLPATPMLYAGQQLDVNAQQYYQRARYYDPANGRFNQRDTFAGSRFEPQSIHKYLSCNCDPVNVVDPSGRDGLADLTISMEINAGLDAVVNVTDTMLVVNGVWKTLQKINDIYNPARTVNFTQVSQFDKQLAHLCQDVYSYPSVGWQSWEPANPKQIGLDPDSFSNGSFVSQLYKEQGNNNYVLAFRGTMESGIENIVGDWYSNLAQALYGPLLYTQYDEAVDVADQVNNAVGNSAGVTMTGHSLGGGLAAVAALSTDRPAVTFNGAGVNGLTFMADGGLSYNNRIENYSVEGELLTTLQRNAPLMPEALGQQYFLPVANVDHDESPLGLHGIQSVLDSLGEDTAFGSQ